MSVRWLRRAAILCAAVAGGTLLASPALAAPAWPIVVEGNSGPQVQTVQYLLRHRGESITADGAFGPLTTAAVQRFQTANGLTADGDIGPLTWPRLVVALDQGASNDAVRALQIQLNRNGAGLAVDGTFGPATAAAVNSFKSSKGIGTGSSVTVDVWQWLAGSSASGGQYALPLNRSALPRGEYDDPHHDYPAIDLPVGTGTQALAAAAGTVAIVNDSSCGRGVVITNSVGVRFIYCHFSSWAVSGGQSVSPGQLVGFTGSTGNSTGPHLHFGIKTGTTNRCPQSFLLALYDGAAVPNPATLPTSGCFTTGLIGGDFSLSRY
jgi:murein DD-endopeptidase MepM/ murein hydrolase activator NlpD